MFEREIKFIYDFNLNKVNRLGPYFTFEQLSSADLHPAILQYISAEIDYLVFEDRQNLLKNSVFDYSGEKISFHFNQISEEVKKSKRFALEYIAKLVMHASSFTANYLAHPKWTLTKFVFDEDAHKSTNEIKQILNYVYYYKYINKIIVTYINAKKILSMNAQEFEELLNKADKLGIESNLSGILSSSLKSMAEFFNIGEKIKTKVPLTAVEMFLDEKKLDRHLTRMVENFGGDENAKFAISDYEKVLNSVVLEKEETIREAPEEKAEETVVEEPFEPVEVETPVEQSEIKETVEPEKAQQIFVTAEETLHGEILEEKFEAVEAETEKHVEEKEELIEEILEPGEDIIITQPTKLRIKISDDIKIEKIEEEELIQEELPFKMEEELTDASDELESDEILDEDSAREHEDDFIDLDIPKLQRSAESNIEDLVLPPTKEMTEEEAEIEFQKELELAQKEFEPDLDDLPTIGKTETELADENLDEDESLSFMLKHKDDKTAGGEETAKTSDVEKETIPYQVVDSDDEIVFDDSEEKNKDIEVKESKEEQVLGEKEKELEQFGEKEFIKGDDLQLIKMDLAEILEHKEMTKIINVIFDYDIEDFAGILDEISNCKNLEEADQIINNTLSERQIDSDSEEAEAFRRIISEYFNRK